MKTLFAIALLALTAAPTYAQIVSPDVLVAPAPQPPARRDAMVHATLRSADLQWLWQYASPAPSGNKAALLADPRFAALLRDQLKTPQAFWGTNRTLSEAATDFLAGEGSVAANENRYLTVTGCVADQCGQKGLLWIDLGARTPLTIFVAKRWIETSKTPDQAGAGFNFYVFPTRNLEPLQLPADFRSTIGSWLKPAHREGCPPEPTTEKSTEPVGLAALVNTDGSVHIVTPGQFGAVYILCTSTASLHESATHEGIDN